MTHPNVAPDPNPPSTAIGRINSVTTAILRRPETIDDDTLDAYRAAGLALAQAAGAELVTRSSAADQARQAKR